ncbi:MAG: aminoacetone oxidase family FAD-binding enzyme [Candidatus Kerfeldbacteria bacterium]|nr:aminoacetone oxidase family FAD-binding enzyme [Candidatus Kerfeldbacteria bacterium]
MNIAIIGGGAAGMMAAATIQEQFPDMHEIFLVEKNPGLGRKVIISGGGRCNVTTGLQQVRELLTKYPRGSKFLNAAMHQFPPAHVYAWFEVHGVPLKIEKDLRVFPRSNDGKDIVGVFERLFRTSKTTLLLHHHVQEIKKINNQFALVYKDGSTLTVDRLILTTGGQARRYTGSSGDGYTFAESLGHTITPLAPSLNAFLIKEAWPKTISGVSFERVTISAYTPKKIYTFTGPLLFTHRGISGPAVFALSSLVAFEHYDQHTPLPVQIDFFPGESFAALEKRVCAAMATSQKTFFKNTLRLFLPKSVAEICCDQIHIPLERKNIETSKAHVHGAVTWMKGARLHAIGRGSGDEFVTAGGVNLQEVNPSTMQSRITPGLFFAGELLDIDGFTGGFNLQASWATGRLAGMHAGKPIARV